MGLTYFLERHGGLDFVAHSGGQNGFISHFNHTVRKRIFMHLFHGDDFGHIIDSRDSIYLCVLFWFYFELIVFRNRI